MIIKRRQKEFAFANIKAGFQAMKGGELINGAKQMGKGIGNTALKTAGVGAAGLGLTTMAATSGMDNSD